MARYIFERECRTPFSECYTVVDDDEPVGRVDIHFAEVMIHSTVSIGESLTNDDIQDLIDAIDRELLDAIGIVKQELVVHVHQGRDLGVFSTRGFEGNGGHERLS
jgi:hypothetical protein